VRYDGPSALEAAAAELPDVMLVDVGMPGMDGYEVARRIRLDPRLGRVGLVALTGYGSEEHRRRAAEAGFDHHLVKPVEPDSLQRVVAELAAKHGFFYKDTIDYVRGRDGTSLWVGPFDPHPNAEGHALYAQALVGSDDETVFNVVKSISLDEARGRIEASRRCQRRESENP
jgi:CheY-like chemotaxis protein